jgi:hypothetical protein
MDTGFGAPGFPLWTAGTEYEAKGLEQYVMRQRLRTTSESSKIFSKGRLTGVGLTIEVYSDGHSPEQIAVPRC